MKIIGSAILLFFFAMPAIAFDINRDIEKALKEIETKIANSPSTVPSDLGKAVHEVSQKIERAALVQSATESALASRIQSLEATVRTQSEVIEEFKVLVSVLKNEIEALKKNE